MRLRKNNRNGYLWFLLSVMWFALLGITIHQHNIGIEIDYYVRYMHTMAIIIVQNLLIGVMSMRNDGIVG